MTRMTTKPAVEEALVVTRQWPSKMETAVEALAQVVNTAQAKEEDHALEK